MATSARPKRRQSGHPGDPEPPYWETARHAAWRRRQAGKQSCPNDVAPAALASATIAPPAPLEQNSSPPVTQSAALLDPEKHAQYSQSLDKAPASTARTEQGQKAAPSGHQCEPANATALQHAGPRTADQVCTCSIMPCLQSMYSLTLPGRRLRGLHCHVLQLCPCALLSFAGSQVLAVAT
jgi:hypothetical protein